MSVKFDNIDLTIRRNVKNMRILQLTVVPAAGGGYIAELVDEQHAYGEAVFKAEGQTVEWALMNLDTACHNLMYADAPARG